MPLVPAEQYLQAPGAGTLPVLLGMVLSVLSDSVLAYDRFVRRSFAAEPLVLALYFPGQLLIALSVGAL